MGLVDIVFPPFLGNEEHPFEEEQSTSVLRSQDMKGSFQNKLSVGGQVWTLPVDQKRLYLLQRYVKPLSFTTELSKSLKSRRRTFKMREKKEHESYCVPYCEGSWI